MVTLYGSSIKGEVKKLKRVEKKPHRCEILNSTSIARDSTCVRYGPHDGGMRLSTEDHRAGGTHVVLTEVAVVTGATKKDKLCINIRKNQLPSKYAVYHSGAAALSHTAQKGGDPLVSMYLSLFRY